VRRGEEKEGEELVRKNWMSKRPEKAGEDVAGGKI